MKRRNWLKLAVVTLVACALTVHAEETKTTQPATPIKGNPTSKVYHKPTCRFYTSKGCTKTFKNEAEAKKAGYKPCKACAEKKKENPVKQETQPTETSAQTPTEQ